MKALKDIKIAVAGTDYVGLSIATLLSLHHRVTAVDVIPEKVEMLNNKKSPIQDDYIEKLLNRFDIVNKVSQIRIFYLLLLIVLLYCIYLCLNPTIVWRDNYFSPSYLSVVVGGFIVLSLLFSCIIIGSYFHLYYITSLGRYSLIVLGTHHLIYRPVEYILDSIGVSSNIVTLIITLVFVQISILIIKNYFPIIGGIKSKSNNIISKI